MPERLTRREIAAALLASSPALAQAQRGPESGEPDDQLAAARKRIRSDITALENFDLPMMSEPALIFKP